MTAAELRMMLGDGPASLVCATTPPSRQVWVGADLHTIDAADLVNPRIDLACMCTDLGVGPHPVDPGCTVGFAVSAGDTIGVDSGRGDRCGDSHQSGGPGQHRGDQAMTFPTPRGTELRLGLHKPEPVVHYDIAPNIEAFMAGMRRLQESMQRSGFSFSVGGRR